MPRFKVVVIVKAECQYECEVEAEAEHEAENKAISLDRELLPSDFQVEKGYINDWDVETTQLTWECVECGKEISEQQWRKGDELCPVCFTTVDCEPILPGKRP